MLGPIPSHRPSSTAPSRSSIAADDLPTSIDVQRTPPFGTLHGMTAHACRPHAASDWQHFGQKLPLKRAPFRSSSTERCSARAICRSAAKVCRSSKRKQRSTRASWSRGMSSYRARPDVRPPIARSRTTIP